MGQENDGAHPVPSCPSCRLLFVLGFGTGASGVGRSGPALSEQHHAPDGPHDSPKTIFLNGHWEYTLRSE
jgi:hypothetical protein